MYRTNRPMVRPWQTSAALAGVLLALVTLSAPARAQSPARQRYEQTLKGTVLVCAARDGKITPAGTGWIADVKQKLIVTNYHVVPNLETAYVTFPLFKDGKLVTDPTRYHHDLAVPGKVIDSDPKNDLAVVQLGIMPEGVRELKLASEKPSPAEQLHLVGNPGASSGYWVYTSGTVRQLVHKRVRYPSGQQLDADVIESQMDTNAGDSGAAVVNDAGEVVAVNSGAYLHTTIRSISWHIDLDELKTFLADVRALRGEGRVPAEVWERRGMRHLRKKMPTSAVHDFTLAIKEDRRRGSAYRNRARAYYLKEDADAAIRDAEEARKIDPDDALAVNEMANAYSLKKYHTRAVELYTEAIRMRPSDPVLYVNRGMSHTSGGKADLGLKDFTAAIRLAPEYVSAYVQRAAAYRTKKEYREAIADYLKASELEPNNPFTLALLGHCYQDARQPADAIEAYAKAIKARHPDVGMLLRAIGHASFDLKRYDQAIEAYTFALKADPKDSSALFWRGACYEEKGQTARAAEDYAAAVKLDGTWGKRLKWYSTKSLVVRNATEQTLEVNVSYEVDMESGEWQWFTAKWEIPSGRVVQLLHDNWKVHARKMRIWATSKTSADTWLSRKDTELALASDRYQARKRAVYVYTFEK